MPEKCSGTVFFRGPCLEMVGSVMLIVSPWEERHESWQEWVVGGRYLSSTESLRVLYELAPEHVEKRDESRFEEVGVRVSVDPNRAGL
jgi:hypothetical protein